MPDNDRDDGRRLRWPLLRRWMFRLLLGTCVLWGMFSAAVVFAVRYNLFSSEVGTPDEALRPLSLDEARDWPVLSASDWRRVIPPDSALVLAHADSTVSEPRNGNAPSAHGRLEWLDFRWAPNGGTAAWIAFIATPSCNCPFESVDRWDIAQIVINPLTGSPLGRALLPDVTGKQLDAQYGATH